MNWEASGAVRKILSAITVAFTLILLGLQISASRKISTEGKV